MIHNLKKTALLFVLLTLTQLSFPQITDSIKSAGYLSGSGSLTNNGISIVPSFSLGKPAAIFNLARGKNRFSFEQELGYSLSGKPWFFLFWGRYKLVKTNKFQVNVGTHLGLNFKTSVLPIDGEPVKTTVTRRYLAGELFPKYFISKNISVGMYYLYAHGIDAGTIGNTQLIALNAGFSKIRLTEKFFIKANPQLYYLKLDTRGGLYFSSSFALAKKKCPFSVSAIINKTINTDITGGKNFLWNAGLAYSFYKEYVKR